MFYVAPLAKPPIPEANLMKSAKVPEGPKLGSKPAHKEALPCRGNTVRSRVLESLLLPKDT